MDISYDWLGAYVDHDLSPDALAEELTTLGLEVDGTETVGQSFDRVVVGRVLEVFPHPNADRLVLCRVDVGEEEPRQIACGAPNVAADQLVPVALEGATVRMPEDPSDEGTRPTYQTITVDRRTIRGEESEGMICAEDELGLSDDHSGIMVLNIDATVGQPFAEHLQSRGLPAEDTIYDIDLTPNRPDAASHIGVARDVAARTETELQRPEVTEEPRGEEIEEEVSVEIEDPEGCPRYVARMVRNVEVGESPPWLQHRLRSIGLEPRNNIVDITNFVLHESGQPLHAFDLDRLADRRIEVRSTKNETPFVTLDGEERELPPESLVIADGRGPVAIAGIMGGRNSEVGPATSDVLIESAYFDPARIRRTAGKLGLSTDSSYRFERGVDRDGQRWAAHRAAHLMAEIAGGTVVPGTIDVHPRPADPTTVSLRPQRVRDVLGAEVSDEDCSSALERLGFEIEGPDGGDGADGEANGRNKEADAERWTVNVPTFRPDVSREVDLIEEIARLVGYDAIPERGHSRIPNQTVGRDRSRRLRARLRRRLTGLGFREIYTNSMLREETARRFTDPVLAITSEEDEVVETLNPISQEMAALRPSLLPGMLEVMAHNRNHGQETLRFFEFGRVFKTRPEDGDSGSEVGETPAGEALVDGYAENPTLLLGLTGATNRRGWDRTEETSDFFDLKGVVEHLLEALRLDNIRTETYSASTPLSAYRLDLYVSTDGAIETAEEPANRPSDETSDRLLGTVARLSREIAEERDLEHPVLIANLREEVLFQAARPSWDRQYDPINRYPRVDRDLDVVVPSDRPVGDLIGAIREAGGSLLQEVDVFDLYEGEHIEEGRKSVGFSLQFGGDHTLVDEEVDERIDAILERLGEEHDARLRQ